jgi:hypothetical protein
MNENSGIGVGFHQNLRWLVAAVIVMCGVSAADAADLTAGTPTEETIDASIDAAWEVSVAPFYGWVPGMKGSVGVFGQPLADIDVTPIDILQNLDGFLEVLEGIYFGAGHVRRGDFGFAWDVVYIDVFSTDQIGGDFVSGTLDVGFTQTMATLLGTYRIHESPRAYVDALAGARISDIDLNVGITLGPGGGSASDGDTWVDPMIGLKGRKYLSERYYLDGWAMIGGFGAASDLVWDVNGVFGYEVKDWLSAFAGFRATGMDYQNGAFVWDVTMYGPVVGFDLRF